MSEQQIEQLGEEATGAQTPGKPTVLWVAALVVTLAVGVVLGFAVCGVRAQSAVPQPGLVATTVRPQQEPSGEAAPQPETAREENSANTAAENTVEPPGEVETTGQKNARLKAKQYLEYQAFSYHGLVAQLEYEGFSAAEAAYGVDKLAVDWKQQAAKKAAEYLEFQPFSRQGLVDQLLYEKFTLEEAEYGVTQNGY